MFLPQNEFTVFLILGLASFRLTRLIVFDKIMEPIRRPFFKEIEEKDEEGDVEIFLMPKEKGLLGWGGQLLSCFWCVGVWVSLLLVLLYIQHWFIGYVLILTLAVAAVGAIIEVIISRIMDI
ncbi:DUF1360 domain-containing protein [Peribacillus simplex]|uniref:DUF1360 domain-containing protein n=1 Tax=Peribacillus simplex TaxID=1478 RepID=UPI00298E262E|nr:DUF1360 domain-containing protein [Peribacillus simplex]MDW7616303.1 DUF1360 domain-containing protein [Peribacillus simplex]